MKNIILIVVIFVSCLNSHAQFGISAGQQSFDAEDWFFVLSDLYQEEVSTLNSIRFGADYWFRLKNQRIEFLPEIGFSKHDQQFENGSFEITSLNFQFNTNIYLLDFNNDCNCPTFSKQSNFLAKGFFIQLSPGFSSIITNQTFEEQNGNFGTIHENRTVSLSNFSLGIGAGLDIGIHDMLTFSPIVGFRYFPNVVSQIDFDNIETTSTSISQLFLGARLGFRLKRDW